MEATILVKGPGTIQVAKVPQVSGHHRQEANKQIIKEDHTEDAEIIRYYKLLQLLHDDKNKTAIQK